MYQNYYQTDHHTIFLFLLDIYQTSNKSVIVQTINIYYLMNNLCISNSYQFKQIRFTVLSRIITICNLGQGFYALLNGDKYYIYQINTTLQHKSTYFTIII